MQPPAPIVVVTNGTDVRILETSTGNPWKPATATEDAFKDLITQASRVAGVDIRHAIDTLMGTAPNVWMQAVRLVSTETIEELTASWDEPALPFAADFLTPRAATHQLWRNLVAGKSYWCCKALLSPARAMCYANYALGRSRATPSPPCTSRRALAVACYKPWPTQSRDR